MSSSEVSAAPAHGPGQAVRTLHPGYFALVMATGIVSVGVHNGGVGWLSTSLLVVAVGCYAVLIVLTVLRIVRYPHAMRADLSDPRRGFALFTFVAATDVLGTRIAVEGQRDLAMGFLAVGAIAWLLLGYVIPWTTVVARSERPILIHANGTWFIWAVASQSVAVLAATLEPTFTSGRRELAVLAVTSWSLGVFLYCGVAVLVAARILLYPFGPEDLTPPYWVAMGATAITMLAGSRIVEMADAPMVEATRGLVAGTSVLYWAFGTWLIPALLAAGVWRHLVSRVPLRYEPTLWSMVFPVGMYGAGSYLLGQADHLPIVTGVGAVETWLAFAVWLVVFVAMLRSVVRSARRTSSAPGAEVRG